LVLAISTVAIGATRHARDGEVGKRSAGTAAIITGTCKAAKVHFSSNDTSTATTSTSMVDLTGASVSFKTGGSGTSCVVADFTGQAFAPHPDLIQIQALLDGVAGSPGVVQLVGDDTGVYSDSYSMQFVWTGVLPGTHLLKIQWKSFFGGSVAINRSTVVVQHK
jgi:hypothetical protein